MPITLTDDGKHLRIYAHSNTLFEAWALKNGGTLDDKNVWSFASNHREILDENLKYFFGVDPIYSSQVNDTVQVFVIPLEGFTCKAPFELFGSILVDEKGEYPNFPDKTRSVHFFGHCEAPSEENGGMITFLSEGNFVISDVSRVLALEYQQKYADIPLLRCDIEDFKDNDDAERLHKEKSDLIRRLEAVEKLITQHDASKAYVESRKAKVNF